MWEVLVKGVPPPAGDAATTRYMGIAGGKLWTQSNITKEIREKKRRVWGCQGAIREKGGVPKMTDKTASGGRFRRP